MTRKSAFAAVEVSVDPATAFRAFTEEIDRWWVPGPINNWDTSGSLGKRIEPGVGGRIVEVYQDDALELGRITVWEPGSRLVYRSSVDESEVDIQFEATGSGTRVSVEHYLLPGADETRAALFWPNVIRWLVPWCENHDPSRPPHRLARVSVGLHYEDPPAAARWLARAFGFGSWDGIPTEGEQRSWVELHMGDVAIILSPLDGKRAPEPVSHTVWVYVDDLDAHHAHAVAAGAIIVEGIRQHGYRAYVAEDIGGHRWTFVQASPSMRAGA
ncbi:VOC family protein [Allorhizocola rhizosphaerae]|uniref:VOC family protein n=1 Tax=Allorhizocola rhizosphaerae TaxID=1872709 RepID=UPI000E3EBBAB|nr:SRPBCC domain-containing protein [Allorhizocola rhizosphaerae]